MIIPSVDLQDSKAVQLVGGKDLAVDAGDPRPIATKFGRVGEIAVIDLDAAMGTGDQSDTIRDLLKRAPCRVGGGIRSVERALMWLDAGARKVILGTAATPELLSQLPKERVMAALDAVNGEVVVEGWKTKTGASVKDKMRELAPYVGGFLVTFVEREGRMVGMDFDRVAELKEAAGDVPLVVAGGIANAEEIGRLDAMGIDVQVGMALYTGAIDLTDALIACLKTDRPDGLFSTVVSNELGETLGLAYSDAESLRAAIERGVGAYHSRSRQKLWVKGETSGAVQELLRVRIDCDRDAIEFRVKQADPGFCHLERFSCFSEIDGIKKLESTLKERARNAPAGSYTARLFQEKGLLENKLREEADELCEAKDRSDVVHEWADVVYFATVLAIREGLSIEDLYGELERRSWKVSRRPGNAKPQSKSEESSDA